MPQVQVLPALNNGPSTADLLSQYLPTIGANLGNYFQNQKIEKQKLNDQHIVQSVLSKQNPSSLDLIGAFSSLSPELQKSITPLFTQFMKQQEIGAKQQQSTISEQQEHQEDSDTINLLADELVKGNIGKFNQINKILPKGRESRAYFDELALAIEKRLANMVGKGALSEVRFNYLMKNLPSSSNTDATNRGILRALAKVFKVNIENKKFNAGISPKNDNISEKVSLEEIFK